MKYEIGRVIMSSIIFRSLFAAVLLLAISSCGDTPIQKKTIWEGRGEGIEVRWDEDDLVIKDQDRLPLSILRTIEEESVRAMEKLQSIDPGVEMTKSEGYEHREELRLLSVVGPLVSYERYSHIVWPEMKMTADERRYVVIHTSRSGRAPILTDYFEKEVIFKALMADTLVKATLAREDWSQPPPITSFDELMNRLADITPTCEYAFTNEMLTSFAFHHIEGEKVAVQIGLRPGGIKCRGMMTPITLMLPIPGALSEPLERADAGSEGIMARDLAAIAGNQKTTLTLH